MFSREEDETGAVRSLERMVAFRAVIRRVLFLAGFLLAGFVITSCWSATASAAESGVDEAPRPVHDKLASAVAKNVTAAVRDVFGDVTAEAGPRDTVDELVDVAPVVPQVDELPALAQAITGVMDAVRVNPVDDVASVANMVHDTSGVLVTIIDTVADVDVVHGAPSAILFQARPVSTVVERGWSPAEAASPAVVVGSRGGDLMVSIVSSEVVHTSAHDIASASHIHRNDLSRQVRDGLPVSPFSAAGSGGGVSTVGSSGGSSAGAVVPGLPRHDDVFVTSGIPADGVHPVRQFAFVPQVSPA